MEIEMEERICVNDGRKFKVMKGSIQELCSTQCEFVNGRPKRASKRTQDKVNEPKRVAKIEAIRNLISDLGWTQRKIAQGSTLSYWKVSQIVNSNPSATDREIETLYQHLVKQVEGMK